MSSRANSPRVVYVLERGKRFLRGHAADTKHFKDPPRDTEHELCLKTRGWSSDPPLFSLRLTTRRSRMSFSLTLFWWICGTVCLLESTKEGLANEPWALWINQHEGVGGEQGTCCEKGSISKSIGGPISMESNGISHFMSFNECLPQFIFTIHRKRVCKCNCANVRIFQRYRTQTWRSLASRDSLTSWHFVRHRQSFLTNEYVWVRPEKACVIFPSFYHTDAGRHSGGIRSTLCRDRQTGSANKMECWCISLISGNIQIPLSIATVCAPLWGGGGQNLWLDFSASGHCWVRFLS